MPPIDFFSPDGDDALRRLLQARPLLAFDFDGTLAPIVDDPAQARATPDVAARLQALAARWPVAVITGRARADVQMRLGFKPRFLVGNHGAEGPQRGDNLGAAEGAPSDDGLLGLIGLGGLGGFGNASGPDSIDSSAALEPLRRQLQPWHEALAAAGVQLEDKGASIALHYRRAPNRDRASTLIQALLAPVAAGLRIFPGKLVVNAMAAAAPDKADALLRLLQTSGADTAFFAGDDINDEPIFDAAAPHWVTVRVGPGRWPTKARFEIDGPHRMAALLDRLLAD
ncbi:MAG: trehalose-phosphatase [Rubrivivax sp.]|nr:trehalose-phosphatase [Rubrivivax sp.]